MRRSGAPRERVRKPVTAVLAEVTSAATIEARRRAATRAERPEAEPERDRAGSRRGRRAEAAPARRRSRAERADERTEAARLVVAGDRRVLS